MNGAGPDLSGHLAKQFGGVAGEPAKAKPKQSHVTLRMTPEERAKLEELAAGMTLSAYIRACVFAEETKRRKKRPLSLIEDKKAAAEALALLGQSRIASNLNQLAYHANIGVLIVGAAEKAQIAQANDHLAAIRSLLMQALGRKQGSASSGSNETETAASRSARTRSQPSRSFESGDAGHAV